ncbi:MAG TPA: glycoside hydrolase family 9 protein [Polyangiaceae bacterium]|nr:glycoside hydrolase family 9 protein [Polyangiaceae bacterium]
MLLAGCDTAENQGCPAGTVLQAGSCQTPKIGVQVSTVGFTSSSPKLATYAAGASTFVIHRVDDDSVVFPDTPGAVGPAIDATDSGEPEVHVVDFSAFTEPGQYYVEVQGIGKSAPFTIADDVFVEPFHAAMLGMFGWRCGTAVSFDWQGTTFGHGDCHEDDGPAVGGWHDAGDYGKYTNNGSFALGMMLLAWDHFRPKLENVELDGLDHDNGIPDYLDECAYQLGWLLGMQYDDGGVSDRITSAQFDGLSVMPEGSTAPRTMAPTSTKATADFAAVASHAARIFREFDPALADRAQQAALNAWQFLLANTTPIPPPTSGFTGSYGAGGNPDPDTDDRFWAAAEIFESTDDPGALAAFEQASGSFTVTPYWDWDNLANLGIFTYLGSTREERDPKVVTRFTNAVESAGMNMAQAAASHPYGRSLGITYNWGINGTIARTSLALVVASRVDPDNAQTYLDTVSLQLAHLFGRNFFGRSMVTGVGQNSPLHPHHRPSIADGIEPPWPGLLVGGPVPASAAAGATPPPPATQWTDDENNYTSNEVAINWNAPLIYALAASLPDP